MITIFVVVLVSMGEVVLCDESVCEDTDELTMLSLNTRKMDRHQTQENVCVDKVFQRREYLLSKAESALETAESWSKKLKDDLTEASRNQHNFCKGEADENWLHRLLPCSCTVAKAQYKLAYAAWYSASVAESLCKKVVDGLKACLTTIQSEAFCKFIEEERLNIVAHEAAIQSIRDALSEDEKQNAAERDELLKNFTNNKRVQTSKQEAAATEIGKVNEEITRLTSLLNGDYNGVLDSKTILKEAQEELQRHYAETTTQVEQLEETIETFEGRLTDITSRIDLLNDAHLLRFNVIELYGPKLSDCGVGEHGAAGSAMIALDALGVSQSDLDSEWYDLKDKYLSIDILDRTKTIDKDLEQAYLAGDRFKAKLENFRGKHVLSLNSVSDCIKNKVADAKGVLTTYRTIQQETVQLLKQDLVNGDLIKLFEAERVEFQSVITQCNVAIGEYTASYEDDLSAVDRNDAALKTAAGIQVAAFEAQIDAVQATINEVAAKCDQNPNKNCN